jgi:hypothetical protein
VIIQELCINSGKENLTGRRRHVIYSPNNGKPVRAFAATGREGYFFEIFKYFSSATWNNVA